MRPTKATGLRRWVYLSLGFVCLVFAAAGAVVPVLPCTPWVLAASFFFARSSDRFSRLLRRSPYFGHILRDWDEHRGIRPWVKATVAVCVTTFMTLMATFTDLSWWAKGPAIGLAAVGVSVVLFVVPTVRAKKGPAGDTTTRAEEAAGAAVEAAGEGAGVRGDEDGGGAD